MTEPYVINLEKRTDRWEELNRIWKGAFKLTRLPAVEASPGWVGCALSHIKACEDAKERGDPHVLVWEDDCVPRNRHPRAIKALWEEVLPKLVEHREQWDIVLGATSAAYKGATKNPGLSTPNVTIYDLPHGFTAHWILYNESSYDKMIAWKTTRDPQIDVYMYNHLRIKVVMPFLAEQTIGFSDIESSDVDYHHMFERTEEQLKNIR
uniref:Glycosyltransferase n=1 Tax=viral metagenome TaxID=1070528 RepID=A0A6C0B6T4_9ZZZZ